MTSPDLVLESVWQIAHVLDYKQTVQIVKHPERWEEASAQHWVGARPNRAKVNLYFAATSLGHIAISCDLSKWRRVWGTVTVVEKLSIVYQNKQLGIRVNF